MDRYLNTVIDGRYDIKQVIGTGGMSIVYKAVDLRSGLTVAIKIMRDELSQNMEFRRRFMTESRAVAMLSHKNIVQIFDVSVRDDIQYIVMEWVNGITLKEYITAKGRLSEEEALHFMRQALKALAHAHGKGIVHRDVKPQNIMLLENGTIKVTDFGIAKILTSETRTMSEMAIGSVHYISPEQVKGERADERSDLYSAGIMFYEMLTGKVPFDADTTVSVALMQMQNEPQPLAEIIPDIKQGLEQIVMKAVEKNPNDRFSSAWEMITAIDSYIENPDMVFDYLTPAQRREKREREEAIRRKQRAQREAEERRHRSVQSKKTPQKTNKKSYSDTNEKPKTLALIVSGVVTALSIVIIVLAVILISDFSAGNNIIGGDNPTETIAPENIKAPLLVGKYFDTLAQSSKYTVVKTKEQYSDDPVGMIIEQDIKEGTSILEGTVINVTVSIGKNLVLIPEVLNMEYREAGIMLKRDYGFEYKREYEFSDTITEGYVTRCEPAEGSFVEPGTTVTLFVSKGKETFVMPSLIGMTEDEAIDYIIEKFGTNPEVIKVKSNEPKGTVVGQSIQENETFEKRQAITIEVSIGPEDIMQYFSSIAIPLPQKDSVFLEIYVDGVKEYEETVFDTSSAYVYTVYGAGQRYVEILVDGEPYATKVLTIE